jgi:hypothetical protein
MVMLNEPVQVYPHKLRRLYWPFLGLAESFASVVGTVAGSFQLAERRYTIPRFTFLGPQVSVPQKRIGLFALVHGDEPAGAVALLQLLQALTARPELASGYDLVLYPVCNPTGYEDDTRYNRGGADLNREFWRGSSQPEVRIIEEELRTQSFDGIIALHADDTSDGLYGYAHGRLLNEELLMPALQASERVLPRNRAPVIDGFAAREGVIGDCFSGILAPAPDHRPRPFEIIFETPARLALERQAEAARIALLSILATYRGFIAYADNL